VEPNLVGLFCPISNLPSTCAFFLYYRICPVVGDVVPFPNLACVFLKIMCICLDSSNWISSIAIFYKVRKHVFFSGLPSWIFPLPLLGETRRHSDHSSLSLVFADDEEVGAACSRNDGNDN